MEAFTTGAYIKSVKDNNGNWHWEVTGFEDSSFIGGEEVNIVSFATSESGLIDDENYGILE